MSFNSDTLRFARKNHKCQCCYKQIDKGTAYIKTFGVNEGDWYQFKFHVYCRDVVDKVGSFLGEAIDPGEAYQLAEEYGVEI